MSHFTVLVINTNGNQDVEESLAPYDENIEMDEYCKGAVDEDDLNSFRKYYTSPNAPDYSKDKVNGEYPTKDMPENASLSDQQLYEKFGEDWNGNRWKFENGAFNEYTTYNPKSKWDWYQVGGRWAGFLKIKEGFEYATPNFSWGWSDDQKQEVLNSRSADHGTNESIDWLLMIAEGQRKAAEKWDKIAEIMGVNSEGKINQAEFTWEQCCEKFGENISKAREFFHNQELIKKFSNIEGNEFFASLSDFNYTKEEYVEMGGNNNISTYAVLLDGEWISKGEMGWFGVSSESDEEANQWSDNFYKSFIEPLNDDAYVTLVDCHI